MSCGPCSSPVPAALAQAGQAFARMTKLDVSRRARAACPRFFRGLVPGPLGDLSPVLQGSRHPEVGFAMSSRDKGERTNDCGKKRKGKKRKSGLSVIDEGQATSDTLFCSHQSRFSARSRLLQRDEDRNQTLTINQRTQRFSNNRAWRFG